LLMLPPGFKITTEMLWSGTLIFAVIDVLFIPILAWRIHPVTFRRFKWTLAVMTAIFWGSLWNWVLANFWDSVYHYVFPAWARWFIPPVYGLLFAGVGLLFWRLALRLRRNAAATFCLLWGVWGMITHLFAVSVGIVDRPPVLQGAAPAAAVIIAIFEFIFYGCVILSLAVLLHLGWRKMRPLPGSVKIL
jgi:hypothetical protein